MVTRNQMTYDILETLRSELKDDEAIDLRQIEEYVKDYRADFAKQHFEKDAFAIDYSFIQPITQLAVSKVDASSVTGVTLGKYLMRTTVTIPNTVTRHGYVGTLLSVSPANIMGQSFEIVDHSKAIASGFGRFNSRQIYAFPYNGYIYLISNSDDFKMLRYINITGVFDNPEEAYLTNKVANGVTAYDYTGDEDYYTPQYLKRYIIASILKDKYGIIMNPPSDKKDNGVHELEK